MGYAKEMMELVEEQWDVATDIAVGAGVLKRCPIHEEVYDLLGGDNQPAYKLGNYKFSAGEFGRVFSDRREMTDTIKEVIDSAAMECGMCAKWKYE
jgi:hypothetical protein